MKIMPPGIIIAGFQQIMALLHIFCINLFILGSIVACMKPDIEFELPTCSFSESDSS